MAEQQSVVLVVDIGDLDRGHNVRTGLGDLDTLVESVREVGILTPVTVSGHGANGDGRWVLVAGYRRVAAAHKAGLSQVPALVTEVAGDDERLVAALVENLVREDLDPVDEARGFALLVEAGWSQGKVSRRVGRSKGHVSKRLRLLVLSPEVQERVRAGDITVEHAYQISRLADRNVGAKKLISLSTKPVRNTEMELKEKTSRDELDERVGEIRAAGLRAVIVKRYWNDPDHTALSQMCGISTRPPTRPSAAMSSSSAGTGRSVPSRSGPPAGTGADTSRAATPTCSSPTTTPSGRKRTPTAKPATLKPPPSTPGKCWTSESGWRPSPRPPCWTWPCG